MKNQQSYNQRKNLFLPAHRVEVLVQCDAGSYQLQSGQGEFATLDPGCASSHCDLIQQPILATIEVVSLLLQPSVLVHVCLSLKALGRLHSVELPGTSLQALLGQVFVMKMGVVLRKSAVSVL